MNSLDTQYQTLLETILEHGVEKKDRTGTGTRSIFGYTIRHNMAEGFPLLTTKKMHWKSIVVELLWFLRGDTNIEFLVKNGCNIWNGDAYKKYFNHFAGWEDAPDMDWFIEEIKNNPEFAERWGDLGPIYGKQWREWISTVAIPTTLKDEDGDTLYVTGTRYADQIQDLITQIKENPDSRRLMVNAWNVGDLNQMVLPPCHYGFQVYTKEIPEWERWNMLLKRGYDYERKGDDVMKICDEWGVPSRKISLMWNQRSVDTFLGLPFNIASYGLLLELLGTLTNMVPDQLIGNLGDVHIYSNHIDQVKEQISREAFPLPKLNINTEFWLTESGECGVGSLDAKSFLNSLDGEHAIKCLLEDDIQLYSYQCHPAIKAPLSN